MSVGMQGHAQATSSVSPRYPAFRGLSLEEDDALKTHLTGILVPKANGQLEKVDVIFRDPMREAHMTDYPYIMIDPLGYSFRRNEEHRGWVSFGYEANTANALAHPGDGWFPIPIMVNYQISVATRNYQQNAIINDILVSTLLPFRFGQLTCPSGTVRRLDVTSGPVRSDAINTGLNQRIFRMVWSIAVSAEITPFIEEGVLVEEVDVQTVQK